jgi:hypothetical protein
MMRKRWLWSLLVLAAGVICGVAIERHGAFWTPTSEVQEPVPNVDFSHMAIATRPVIATESGGTAKVRVKAQERCALGYATCDKPQQRTVEAVCLGSRTTVVIDEKDWPAFRRIQDEDLKGIENVPKDMRLCAAWEQ